MRLVTSGNKSSAAWRALLWCLAAAVVIAAPVRAALAQDDPAGQGPGTNVGGLVGGGHGWVVVRTGPERRPALLHLPPRSGENAVERGTTRFAAWLNEEPGWIGTWGNRVYLVFRAGAEGGGIGPEREPRRHVVMLSATPMVAGLWEHQPSGRFRTLPSLPGEGEVAGFVATSIGPVALLRMGEAGGEGGAGGIVVEGAGGAVYRLMTLRGGAWVLMELPWEGTEGAASPPGAEARVHLVAMPEGPALVVEGAASGEGAATLWLGRVDGTRRSWTEAAWEAQPIESLGPLGGIGGGGWLLGLDGQLLRVRPVVGEGLVLDLVRPGRGGGVYKVARYPDVPVGAQVIPMHGAGTLAIMWPVEEPGADGGAGRTGDAGASPAAGRNARGYELREVSAFSGRVWYSGGGTHAGLVATRQFQVLAVALVIVMATVLLFILRPGAEGAALPPGVMAAEPSRRIAAAAADFLLGVLLASTLTGIGGSEMLSPMVLMGSREAAGALLLAFWMTFVHTAGSEWLFGRSLGKAMAGCEVVRVERAPAAASGAEGGGEGGGGGPGGAGVALVAKMERPLLWQALARNAVRWGLPPMVLWLLADPGSRHPGDLLARTMVVVRTETPGETPGGGKEPGPGGRGGDR